MSTSYLNLLFTLGMSCNPAIPSNERQRGNGKKNPSPIICASPSELAFSHQRFCQCFCVSFVFKPHTILSERTSPLRSQNWQHGVRAHDLPLRERTLYHYTGQPRKHVHVPLRKPSAQKRKTPPGFPPNPSRGPKVSARIRGALLSLILSLSLWPCYT